MTYGYTFWLRKLIKKKSKEMENEESMNKSINSEKKTDSNGKKAYNKKVDSRYPNKDILNILKIFSWNIVTFWGTGS